MRGVKRAVTPKVKNGTLWLDFNYKPDFQQRKVLKSVGFRWSPARMMWWCKNTTEARRVANTLNLTEFIPKPEPTEADFMEWQKSLKRSEWHNLVTQGEALTQNKPVDFDYIAEFENMLHEKFIAQWV